MIVILNYRLSNWNNNNKLPFRSASSTTYRYLTMVIAHYTQIRTIYVNRVNSQKKLMNNNVIIP